MKRPAGACCAPTPPVPPPVPRDRIRPRSLRALRFQHPTGAAAYTDPARCAGCEAPCETACLHYDTPIRIRAVASQLPPPVSGQVDLGIDFCGVHCENPFFLSSSVVASGYEMCAKAFQLGWAGVVYKTVGFLTPREVSPRFDITRGAGEDFLGLRTWSRSPTTPQAGPGGAPATETRLSHQGHRGQHYGQHRGRVD